MQLYHLKAKPVVLNPINFSQYKVQQNFKKNEGRERGRKGCTTPSITNKKNPKPRIFFFSANTAIFKTLRVQIFTFQCILTYQECCFTLESMSNTFNPIKMLNVYPLKLIRWLKPKCLYNQYNFLEKLMHTVESSLKNQGQRLQMQLLVLNQFQYNRLKINEAFNRVNFYTGILIPTPFPNSTGPRG